MESAGKRIHTKHGAISANKLLIRPPREEYVEQWTRLLGKEHDLDKSQAERSLLYFRLGNEWLALHANCLLEVSEQRQIHRIPHRMNSVLKGLVNLKGQLRLCVDLHRLLEIENIPPENESYKYKRLLSIQQDDQIWIFPVDEVYGIQHVDLNELENVPVTVVKSTVNFLRGVIPWDRVNVGYLDEELLFSSLQRSAL